MKCVFGVTGIQTSAVDLDGKHFISSMLYVNILYAEKLLQLLYK